MNKSYMSKMNRRYMTNTNGRYIASTIRTLALTIAIGTIAVNGQTATTPINTNLPKSALAGSTHDIGASAAGAGGVGAGCKGCHAPHNGATAIGGPQSTGVMLLWARNLPDPTKPYGTYTSPSNLTSAKELSNGTALTLNTDARMYSLLCLSCHDGVTSMLVVNSVNMVGSVASSAGLTNDHPINMVYDLTVQPALNPITNNQVANAAGTSALPLFSSSTGLTVQCATCHDAHNTAKYTNYLRQPNTAAHCLTCHT